MSAPSGSLCNKMGILLILAAGAGPGDAAATGVGSGRVAVTADKPPGSTPFVTPTPTPTAHTTARAQNDPRFHSGRGVTAVAVAGKLWVVFAANCPVERGCDTDTGGIVAERLVDEDA